MSKKKKYSVEELKKIGQGERLSALRVELGFKTRKSFAISINYSASTIDAVEEFKRPISKNLIEAIDNKYKNQYDKEWLLKGTLKKLLTTERFRARMIEDNTDVAVGGKECFNCDKKDTEINKLQEELNAVNTELSITRKELIECLKEVSALRKAPSG